MYSPEPVDVGNRIKKIRLLRGLTQKQLGDRVGLSDVRIRQYEMGIRRPKNDMLEQIAKALDVRVEAISDPNLDNMVQALHTLFMMEDHLGAHPVKINDAFYISFYEDDSRPYMDDSSDNYIRPWYNHLNEYQTRIEKNPSNAEAEKRNYDLWRYRFPLDDNAEKSRQVRRMVRMEELREELARLEEEEREEKKKDPSAHDHSTE